MINDNYYITLLITHYSLLISEAVPIGYKAKNHCDNDKGFPIHII